MKGRERRMKGRRGKDRIPHSSLRPFPIHSPAHTPRTPPGETSRRRERKGMQGRTPGREERERIASHSPLNSHPVHPSVHPSPTPTGETGGRRGEREGRTVRREERKGVVPHSTQNLFPTDHSDHPSPTGRDGRELKPTLPTHLPPLKFFPRLLEHPRALEHTSSPLDTPTNVLSQHPTPSDTQDHDSKLENTPHELPTPEPPSPQPPPIQYTLRQLRIPSYTSDQDSSPTDAPAEALRDAILKREEEFFAMIQGDYDEVLVK